MMLFAFFSMPASADEFNRVPDIATARFYPMSQQRDRMMRSVPGQVIGIFAAQGEHFIAPFDER